MSGVNDKPGGRVIDPYTLLLIETTSQRTAAAMIDNHKAQCDITELCREVWGSDKKIGIKTEVDRLKTAEAGRKGVMQWAMDKLAGPVVVGVVLFFLLGGAGKKETGRDTLPVPTKTEPASIR